MKTFGALFASESRLFLRDFLSLFFTMAFPCMAILMFGMVYGNDPAGPATGQGALDLTAPFYIVMVTGVTGLMSLPLTLTAYQDRKIYKRFDASPAGKESVILTQIAVNIAMTFVGIGLLLAVAKLAFQLRIAGSFGPIFLSVLLSTACMFALGFFLTSLSRDPKVAAALCFLMFFVSIFLSGAAIPQELLPDALDAVSRCLPMHYAVALMQAAFAGESLADCTAQLLVLLGVTAGCLVFGGLLTRRRSWT